MASLQHHLLVATVAGIVVGCGGEPGRGLDLMAPARSYAIAGPMAEHEVCATVAAKRFGVRYQQPRQLPPDEAWRCAWETDALIPTRKNIRCEGEEPVAGVVLNGDRVSQVAFYSGAGAPTCLSEVLGDWAVATAGRQVEEIKPDGAVAGYRVARDDLGLDIYRVPVGGSWRIVAVTQPGFP